MFVVELPEGLVFGFGLFSCWVFVACPQMVFYFFVLHSKHAPMRLNPFVLYSRHVQMFVLYHTDVLPLHTKEKQQKSS